MIFIDISAEYIDIFQLKGSRQNPSVMSSTSLKVRPDLFLADTQLNFSVLEDSIRGVLAKLTDKKVVLSFSYLPNIYSVIYLHPERIQRQQRIAIESQVYANISPEDYYVDYVKADLPQREDKQAFITYAMPKKIVDDSILLLKKLNKTPVALVPSQHAVSCFADRYFNSRVVAFARPDEKSITLHLINPPDNLITRNIALNSTEEVSLNPVQDGNRVGTLIQNIEKLSSYQAIKFPGNPITEVLLFGHRAEPELLQSVNESIGLDCSLLADRDKNFESRVPIYTLGSFLSVGKNEINLFNVAGNRGQLKPKKPANIPLVVSVALLAINVAITATVVLQQRQTESLIEQLQQELTSPENTQQIEYYNGLREEYVGRIKGEFAHSTLMEEIKAQGEFDREKLNTIIATAPEGITVTAFSYADKSYNVSCVGTSEQQASNYVMMLIDLNIFKSVEYHGFSESGDGVTFTIGCMLS